MTASADDVTVCLSSRQVSAEIQRVTGTSINRYNSLSLRRGKEKVLLGTFGWIHGPVRNMGAWLGLDRHLEKNWAEVQFKEGKSVNA